MKDQENDFITEEEADRFNQLNDDQKMDLIAQGLEAFCRGLEAKGVDPALITDTIFAVFCDRAAELGDREAYEELLTVALEDPWEEYTVH
jgi:hypothetical protein